VNVVISTYKIDSSDYKLHADPKPNCDLIFLYTTNLFNILWFTVQYNSSRCQWWSRSVQLGPIESGIRVGHVLSVSQSATRSHCWTTRIGCLPSGTVGDFEKR